MTTDELVGAVMAAYAPPPDLTPSEWAETHRRLPVASASRGARWSNTTAPYLTEIQDATNDPSAKKIVIMGCAQSGKTEATHNCLGYWIAHDPSTVLLVMPSFEDAKRRSRGALSDMIRSTPELRSRVRGRRAPRGGHEAESTLLEKVYAGGSLILAGSGTPNSFAGVSARRVIGDEFERFALLEEGAPDVLLANRTSSFYDGLVILISTPLLVDGKIHSQFKLTDQRRYFLSCPCGRSDYTTWQDANHFRVVYEERRPETARLECPGCQARYDEVARRRLVTDGRWRPTADPIETSSFGFHIPGMIATLGDVTLPRLVEKWISAQANGPMALMSFVNTVLAEAWEHRSTGVEAHALKGRLEDYGEGVDVPPGVICLTAGVDVQIDRFEVQVIGWGLGGESWVIDTRVIPGDPTLPDVQAALLATFDETYRHADGHQMPILVVAVDAGYQPERVAYYLAAQRPRRVFAVKGVGGRIGDPSILKYDPRKPPVIINVDALKLEIELGINDKSVPGPGYMHLSRRVCDEEYLAQLCAERPKTLRKHGVAYIVFEQIRDRNESRDTAGYARAAFRLLRILRGARTDDAMLIQMAAPPPPPLPPAPARQPWIQTPSNWLGRRR